MSSIHDAKTFFEDIFARHLGLELAVLRGEITRERCTELCVEASGFIQEKGGLVAAHEAFPEAVRSGRFGEIKDPAFAEEP